MVINTVFTRNDRETAEKIFEGFIFVQGVKIDSILGNLIPGVGPTSADPLTDAIGSQG